MQNAGKRLRLTKKKIMNQPPTYPRVRFVFSSRTGVARGRARAYARRSRVDPADKKNWEGNSPGDGPFCAILRSAIERRCWETVHADVSFFPISRRWGVNRIPGAVFWHRTRASRGRRAATPSGLQQGRMLPRSWTFLYRMKINRCKILSYRAALYIQHRGCIYFYVTEICLR